jgi:hydrogenase maturation protease
MSGILVAGIGNVFFGDDGFGVEVVRRLEAKGGVQLLAESTTQVRVVDFGIRGIDLCYALLDGVDAAILIDATQRGGVPGTLYLIEPSRDAAEATDAADPYAPPVLMSPHEMDPAKVLQTVRMLGGGCEDILVLGCEPADFGFDNGEEGRMGLSLAVGAVVDQAADMVETLIGQTMERLSLRTA